jgi:hypothetical protein
MEVVMVIEMTTAITTVIEIRMSIKTPTAISVSNSLLVARSHILSHANEPQDYENIRHIEYDTEHGTPGLK